MAERAKFTLRAPVLSLILPVAIVSFLGGLVTDIAYLESGGNFLFLNFSSWLIASGLVFGLLAAVALLVATLRRETDGWLQFGVLLAAWIVEFINSLIHARDGWTAVAPAGLTLSVVGAVLILLLGWLWQSTRNSIDRERA